MLRNYFKTAYRNLLRYRSFSLINILGMAGGLGVCMFIITLIMDQNAYDDFHTKKDRLFRVVSTEDASFTYATAPVLLKDELKAYPQVEEVVRIRWNYDFTIKTESKELSFNGLYVDSTFLDVFDFPLAYGQKEQVLNEPYSVVLRAETAEKLGLNPATDLGKSVQINEWGYFKVAGILEPDLPRTHFKFDILVSYSTVNSLRKEIGIEVFAEESWQDIWNTYVYVLKKQGTSESVLRQALVDISQRTADKREMNLLFELQPLSDIAPSKRMGNELGVTMPAIILNFLLVIAVLVLLTACFNYTNLTVAQALTRVKEIGVRKIMGARRKGLMLQFVIESVFLCLLALGLASIMLEWLILPQFKGFTVAKMLDFELDISIQTYMLFLGLSLGTGIIAGLLPAVYLSGFPVLGVLKSVSDVKLLPRLGLRKVLVSAQYVITLVFFISIVLLFQQTQKYYQTDYGFRQDHVINLQLQGQSLDQVKNLLSSRKEVIGVSGSSLLPGLGSLMTNDVNFPGEDEAKGICQFYTDQNFASNMGLNLVVGKFWGAGEEKNKIVVNELLVKKAGWTSPHQAIGQVLTTKKNDSLMVSQEIIGVVEDFVHYRLSEENYPLMIHQSPKNVEWANIRVVDGGMESTTKYLGQMWSELDPTHTINYNIYDEVLYTENVAIFDDSIRLLGFISLITILITSMGLLGMASYLVRRKRKEISIRKVLGAGMKRILWKLSHGLITPILVAIAIATPLAFFLNQSWLSGLANSVEMGVLNVGLGVLIMLLLASGIILSQAYAIAIQNPVDSLRDE